MRRGDDVGLMNASLVIDVCTVYIGIDFINFVLDREREREREGVDTALAALRANRGHYHRVSCRHHIRALAYIHIRVHIYNTPENEGAVSSHIAIYAECERERGAR